MSACAGALRLAVVSVVMLASIANASACAICFSGRVVTVGQQLDAADQAVLAASGTEQFRVVAVVKGDAVIGSIVSEPVSRIGAATLQDGRPLLLVRNDLGRGWMSPGAIGQEHADWLRALAATGHAQRGRPRPAWPQAGQAASELTDEAWRERLALVAPYLEHPDALAADIAYGEVSRAPYAAMRSLKPRLDKAQIASWIGNPQRAARRSAYTLLLGIAGGPDDAARLEQDIDKAWRSRDAVDLAAMLAADLELRGPPGVDGIEQRYFADRDRTMPEIEAALLALSVHGGASGIVPRERVIAAYRFFIRERKPMAGFVAHELANWGSWDATSDYAALLKSDAIKDPASHFAVVSYLQRSPRSDARAALRSLQSR